MSHVDDFLCSGPVSQLKWLRSMPKEKYEADGDVLGFEEGEVEEGTFLGRKIRYVDGGIEMEVDPKQVAALVAEFGLGE